MRTLFIILLISIVGVSQTHPIYRYGSQSVIYGNSIASDTTTDVYYNMTFNPNMWMPDTIYIAEGNSIEIYNNDITYVPYIKKNIFTYQWTSTIGYDNGVSLIITGASVGNYTAKCVALLQGSRTDSASTIIKVEAKKVLGSKVILPIGNSITGIGWATMRPILSDSLNITLTSIGTQGSGLDLNEGMSGWSYANFYNYGSPFWFSGGVDFPQYLTDNSFADPDVVRMSCGIAECWYSNDYNNAITYATLLIDSVLTQLPSANILISLPTTESLTPAAVPVGDEIYILCMRNLHQAIFNKFAHGAYNARVDVNYDELVIDRTNGYPVNDVHPNTLGYQQLIRGTLNVINHIY